MRNVIIAFWCNFILTGIVYSTTNSPACDLVSSDKSKCYFHRSRALSFVDSIAFCDEELQADLPSKFDPRDESDIARLGLSFWSASQFQLHHDQTRNRIQLLNSRDNFTERRWDFTDINLTIFWTSDLYCAQAVSTEDQPPTSSRIAWAPKDCNLLSGSILCERSLTPESTTTSPDVIHVTSSITSSNDDFWLNETEEIAEEVFEDPSHAFPEKSEDEIRFLETMYIMTQSLYYLDRLKKEMLASLLAAIVMVMFLMIARIVMRRLRRSSSAYFTVHKDMALVYVRSDVPEAEIPENTCTSFIIRGYE